MNTTALFYGLLPNGIQVAGSKTYHTTDYSLFVDNPGQPSSRDHSERIAASMMANGNLLNEFPVVVVERWDGLLEIQDGHNRFRAALSLGEPVYYKIASTAIDIDTVREANSTQKAWSRQDYLDSFCQTGNPNYLRLRAISEEFGVKIATLLSMIPGGRKEVVSDFRGGRFVLDKEAEVELRRALTVSRDFAPFFKGFKDARFMRALQIASNIPGYHHPQMLDKLKFMSRRVVKCVDIRSYLAMLEEIYNFKARGAHLRMELPTQTPGEL
jgi:hypothetical protein